MCLTLDGPFRAASESRRWLGPELLAREQRVRAATGYYNIVTWSLCINYLEGWTVDVAKCVRSCEFYGEFKSCCHIIIGQKSRWLGGPGATTTFRKLLSRQTRKQ
ncbi:hypothetical protein GQ600_25020 [Phytophthora cactorum]|nr:hypothetical protein GQ600_25020 [Phytophthora cactorum]